MYLVLILSSVVNDWKFSLRYATSLSAGVFFFFIARILACILKIRRSWFLSRRNFVIDKINHSWIQVKFSDFHQCGFPETTDGITANLQACHGRYLWVFLDGIFEIKSSFVDWQIIYLSLFEILQYSLMN